MSKAFLYSIKQKLVNEVPSDSISTISKSEVLVMLLGSGNIIVSFIPSVLILIFLHPIVNLILEALVVSVMI